MGDIQTKIDRLRDKMHEGICDLHIELNRLEQDLEVLHQSDPELLRGVSEMLREKLKRDYTTAMHQLDEAEAKLHD
jgi:hypothetical protein